MFLWSWGLTSGLPTNILTGIQVCHLPILALLCRTGPGDGKAKVSQVVGARDAGVMGSMSLCRMLGGEK